MITPSRGARLEHRDWFQLFPPSAPVDPEPLRYFQGAHCQHVGG